MTRTGHVNDPRQHAHAARTTSCGRPGTPATAVVMVAVAAA